MNLLRRFRRTIRTNLPERYFNLLLKLKGSIGKSPYKEYNHKSRSIFIHVPKAAGTSVYSAMYGKVQRDHIQLVYFEAFDKRLFRQYFKFAFVRNPYDRLVSSFNYIKKINDHYTPLLSSYNTFSEFVSVLANRKIRDVIFKIPHFRPQVYYLKAMDGKLGLDFIGRFENLQSDFNSIAEKLQVNSTLGHKNSTEHRQFMEYYNSDTIKIVNEIYKEDFEMLGYRMVTT